MKIIDDLTPALMVVDLGLPGLSGEILIEQVREHKKLTRMPIAVLSSRDLTLDERARLMRHVSSIVEKGTLSRDELFQKLALLCSRSASSSPLRVLAIDDTALNRKLLRAMLEEPDYEVIEAADGPRGIEAARNLQPSVILMDVQMPGMDGLTALALLKADPKTNGIPVIAVTAHAMAGDAERMLAAGCAGYVSKSISRAKLEAALAISLGRLSTQAPVGPLASR